MVAPHDALENDTYKVRRCILSEKKRQCYFPFVATRTPSRTKASHFSGIVALPLLSTMRTTFGPHRRLRLLSRKDKRERQLLTMDLPLLQELAHSYDTFPSFNGAVEATHRAKRWPCSVRVRKWFQLFIESLPAKGDDMREK